MLWLDRVSQWAHERSRPARFQLIKILAGKDHVAINLVVNKNGNVFTVPEGCVLMAYNCWTDGSKLGGACLYIESKN